MKRIILFLGFLMFLASIECSAQEASSFEQLQVLVKPGDNIFVTDSQGVTTKGRIAGLSSSTLGLTVKGIRRDLMKTDVREIRQWRGDSLKNGALIGAGVGAGLIIATAIAVCDEGCDAGGLMFGAAFSAGIGAAIGVGIDALIPTKQTIYRNPGPTTVKKFQVRPILNRTNKGVKVAFSF